MLLLIFLVFLRTVFWHLSSSPNIPVTSNSPHPCPWSHENNPHHPDLMNTLSSRRTSVPKEVMPAFGCPCMFGSFWLHAVERSEASTVDPLSKHPRCSGVVDSPDLWLQDTARVNSTTRPSASQNAV